MSNEIQKIEPVETGIAKQSQTSISLSELGGQVVAVPQWAVDEMDELLSASEGLSVTDSESFEKADELNRSIRNWTKRLEENRTKANQPLLAITRQVNAAVKEASAPLQKRSQVLSQWILQYKQRLEREAAERRREEQEKIRIQLEAEQRAEAKRIEAENKIAEAARFKDADARHKAELEAKALAEESFKASSEAAKASQEVFNQQIQPEPEAVKSSSVTTVTTKELVIENGARFPEDWVGPDGKVFTLLKRDLPEIKRAVRAGMKIHGCYFRDVTKVRSL